MTHLFTRDGKLLVRDGKLLSGDGDCCCDGGCANTCPCRNYRVHFHFSDPEYDYDVDVTLPACQSEIIVNVVTDYVGCQGYPEVGSHWSVDARWVVDPVTCTLSGPEYRAYLTDPESATWGAWPLDPEPYCSDPEICPPPCLLMLEPTIEANCCACPDLTKLKFNLSINAFGKFSFAINQDDFAVDGFGVFSWTGQNLDPCPEFEPGWGDTKGSALVQLHCLTPDDTLDGTYRLVFHIEVSTSCYKCFRACTTDILDFEFICDGTPTWMLGERSSDFPTNPCFTTFGEPPCPASASLSVTEYTP